VARATNFGVYYIVALFNDVPAANKVAHSMHVTERGCNIDTGCMSVRVDASCTNDKIERFKGFSGIKHCWAKESYVEENVEENVELWFIEPLCIPQSSSCEKIINGTLKMILEPKHQ